jgi:DNA-binding NtrC family response regulator
MKVLMSWIGLADLRASDSRDENDLGPVGLALTSERFDHAVLLSNQSEEIVATYLAWLQGIASRVQIEVEPVELSSPSNFAEIFRSVSAAIEERRDILEKASEVLFYLSPGTPVMAATWLILGKTRYEGFRIGFLESSQRELKRVEVPFDLAANILPDVIRVADEQLTQRGEGKVEPGAGFADILHRSPQMNRLIANAQKVARRSMNVLIEGESGTGKELLANAIHTESLVADGPFIPVNCGAIPENLVESELFGHTKGAFTGATGSRAGYIEEADGGTLFLDEVGELPLSTQVKLLRALQERTVTRVGSHEAKKVNVRLVAATNRNLAIEVAEGRFREDLFYRLCVVNLTLPPLRERVGDLDLLIDRFLKLLNDELRSEGGEQRILSQAARATLHEHGWPGNVRELQNTMQRLVFLSDNAVLSSQDVRDALLPVISAASGGEGVLDRPLGDTFNLREVQAEVARHYMRRALEASGNRISRAATLIGTTRQNFSNWMREYKVDLPDPSV